MKLSVRRFRARGPENTAGTGGTAQTTALQAGDSPFATEDDGFGSAPFETAQGDPATPPASPAEAAELEAIAKEGLTIRQLRIARRLAARHGLAATSDHDAVRRLRKAGIDPFQRGRLLELVRPEPAADAKAAPAESPSRAMTAVPVDQVHLPQKVRPVALPSPDERAERNHAADLLEIQRDIARRRRRRSLLLVARLFVFVLVPAIAAGIYYYTIATPLYATKSEFVIQQAENPVAGGMGGLLRGTSLATSQDSIAVQGYLQSREAMLRLDTDHGFRAHFSNPAVDDIQRLAPDATLEDAYKVYTRHVKISYDPTEGIIKMEVMATDPDSAARFASALISYAEEQVDHLTQRLREDQMKGARESYQEAEDNMLAAQLRMVELQEKLKVLSSDVEVSLLASQIGQLQTQLTTEKLALEQMRLNENPNEARMEPVIQRIKTLEQEIAGLRALMTEDTTGTVSLAKVQSELLVAEADIRTRQMLLAQSLQSMETARIEANRQVRYLSVSVKPIVPDEPAYPRAFENTMVALLLFAAIYLMISMTAEILREQVSA